MERMMSKELTEALAELKNAVKDQGPQPEYHQRVMVETYRKWPTLWRAVEKVLAAPEVRKL